MSQTIIDDQDLSHVKYNGIWIRGGTIHEHNATVVSSTEVNDFFTVSFSGNSIAVYGTIDSTSGGALTNYSVDGATPSQVTSQGVSEDTYNQQFWKSSPLSEGDHNLVVTMVKVNAESQATEGTVWFDYFVVTDTPIQSSSSSTTTKPSNQPTVTITSKSSSTTKSKNVNVGAIVGGVIGGVLVLIFISLVIIALLVRRRNNRQLNHIRANKEDGSGISPTASEDIIPSRPPTIEPFPLREEENQFFNAHSSTPTSPSTTSRKGAMTMTHYPALSIASSSTPPSSILWSPTNTVATLNPPSRKRQDTSGPTLAALTAPPSSSSLSESAIQHVDSGLRVANMDAIQTPIAPVELPPVYSPV